MAEEVEERRDKKPMVESLAEEKGHKMLFLPVHHPELNPIELAWATAKNQCASLFSNATSFKEPRENLETAFQEKVNSIYCHKIFNDINKIEKKYWEADLAIDDELETGEESL